MATAAHVDQTRNARLFQALSDEVRLEIISLIGDGEHCVCEITSALDIAQSRLSFHLKVLKDAGLVTDRRDGRWIYYTLSRDAFDEAAAVLGELRPRARRSAPSTTCCS
jgi:ArsR family transcriptional regulator, arsenate/arsenite/antimonite-responsive transcriptional repressor